MTICECGGRMTTPDGMTGYYPNVPYKCSVCGVVDYMRNNVDANKKAFLQRVRIGLAARHPQASWNVRTTPSWIMLEVDFPKDSNSIGEIPSHGRIYANEFFETCDPTADAQFFLDEVTRYIEGVRARRRGAVWGGAFAIVEGYGLA